jgi:hypothetical protein
MQRVLDDFAILFTTIPIYVPIVRDLGFDTTWFAALFILSMQSAYLTPPLWLQPLLHAIGGAKIHHHCGYLLLGAALRWFSACRPCTGCRFSGHCAVATRFVVLTNASPVLQVGQMKRGENDIVLPPFHLYQAVISNCCFQAMPCCFMTAVIIGTGVIRCSRIIVSASSLRRARVTSTSAACSWRVFFKASLEKTVSFSQTWR